MKITFWKEAMDSLLVKIFVESYEKAPEQIVLDIDTTDLPLHGRQEGRFFHGYHDNYCYLPLYIFCGEHVLCARLREANHDRFWQPGGNRTHRPAAPNRLAGSENHSARGLRLLPQ
jgi:hypothetical protein